jgi:hypothetical protein
VAILALLVERLLQGKLLRLGLVGVAGGAPLLLPRRVHVVAFLTVLHLGGVGLVVVGNRPFELLDVLDHDLVGRRRDGDAEAEDQGGGQGRQESDFPHHVYTPFERFCY